MSERQEAARKGWEGEMFRLLAENVKDYAIFLLSGDRRIEAWTPAAQRLLGYSEDEILGQSADVLFTPDDIQQGAPQIEIEQARATGRGEDDRWHVRKDGSRFWASGVVTPLKDDRGQVWGFAKLMRDRTEWQEADQVRRESEASKAAVLETALDGIITIDQEDRIIEFNPAAERLFGYRRSDVLGQKMGDLIVPPRHRANHYRGLAHYLASGEGPVLGKRVELSAMRADGAEFPVELAIVRVPTEGVIHFTGYIRDISERETQERRSAVQLEVTRVLAEAATVGDAAVRILHTVCEGLVWDVGGFWLLDRQAQVLRCLDVWHQPQVQASEFAKASLEQSLPLGVGLPGRACLGGQPLWLSELDSDENFPRLSFAAEAGLRSAFAIPLLLGDQVLGAIEFLSRCATRPDANLLRMLATIGGQIGQFIQRKHAEGALRESEQRFRGMMEQAPFSVQVFAADGLTLQVNRAWESLWGLSADQVVGKYNVLEDAQPATKAAFEPAERAFAGDPITVPAVQCAPGGTSAEPGRHGAPSRWVSAVAYPLKSPNGQVREVVLIHEDITARKQTQNALRESEERFRGIVNHSTAGVAELDLTGQFVFANERYCQIVGRSFSDLLELRMQDISHPDDLAESMATFEHLRREGVPYVIEKRYRRPDGSEVWVNSSVAALRDHDGRVSSVVAVCVDVTERKRTEQDLRFVADVSRSLATLVDYKSTLQRIAGLAVPHFADWCSVYLREEPEGLRQLAVAHVDSAKIQVAEAVRERWPADDLSPAVVHRVLRTGQPAMVEDMSDELLREMSHDDKHLGMLRELGLRSYICVPLTVRESTIGAIVFVAAESGRRYTAADLALAGDLAHRAAVATENARLYAKLRDEARKKDEFLAMLAHELRNPLAPIRSGLDLLGIMGTDREVLDMMQRQTDHLVRLVDDLLDVSRIMRGKVELRRESVELSVIVSQAVDAVRPLVEQHQQQLSQALPEEPVWLDADPVRMAQIIGNLLNNACKYSETGGSISLSAERKDEQVLIRVRDAGIGIGPELLPHVFDLFTQDQRAIDRSQGGLGIGLTVVKNLVEMHGGSVNVLSEGPGLGSEFILRLPTMTPPSPPTPSDPTRTESPVLRILVVDDNIPAAKMLALLLSKIGNHQVVTAHDGIAALKAAKEEKPDLVLLDIGLPHLDGFEVARRLRENPELRQMQIVALTGYGTEEDRRKSLDAGFQGHLVKPPGVETLRELLARVKQSTADRLRKNPAADN